MNSRLKFLNSVGKRGGHKYAEYLCDCGVIKVIRVSHVDSGDTLSCGCLNLSINTEGRTGINRKIRNDRLYRIWGAMKQRCYNKNSSAFPHYGGKGIVVCEEWLNSYKDFLLWAMDNNYSDGLSIDRINPMLGYSPENCRWVTLSENTTNALNYNFNKKIGQFSEESKKNQREQMRIKQGRPLILVSGDDRVYFNSLIDAAEYVREIKELETCTNNIKKNIHACLVGKRKSCYGYKAIDPWEEF